MLSARTWDKIAKKHGLEMAKRIEQLSEQHEKRICGFPFDDFADFIVEWETVTAKLRTMKK